jgi:hypothetical protein
MKKILIFLLTLTVTMISFADEYQSDDLTGLSANLDIVTYTSEPCGIA